MTAALTPYHPIFPEKENNSRQAWGLVKHRLIFTLLLLLGFGAYAQPRIISTYAGNGTRGYSGNGGAATAASLNGPENLYADKQGNIYVPDYQNRVIRKINTAGVISLFAGTGEEGYSGDGGKAKTLWSRW